MKKLICLIFIILNSVLVAADTNESTAYIRGYDLTVDSATLKNGLAIQNSLILNRLIGGTTNFTIPATNQFKGKGIEIGINKRHSGLLGTDFGISFATLFADSNYTGVYANSSLRVGSGSSAINLSSDSFTASEFTSNRLQTANIKLAENIYFFHDSGQKFLEGLALRVGGEIYGNEIKATSPYNIYNSNSNINGTIIQGSGFAVSPINETTYNEAYLNAILGIGYNLKIAEGHNLTIGYEYLKSVANSGNYKSKTKSLLVLSPTLAFPSETKMKGKVESEMEGNRINLGYRFMISENVSFGINYSHTEATHRVVDSKVKEPGNFFTLLTSGSSFNPIPFLLGSQPGFGPFPENKDIRRQIGIEFALRY